MARKVSFSRTGKPQCAASIENPPQALQRPVARARHRADVPPQQDQRHMGAQGQRRAWRILDQGLRPRRRLRGCRRHERADVLSGAGRSEEAGARRGRQRRLRTDHSRRRADRLQDRSDSRNANPYNAEWPRVHLTSVLLSKPVAMLAATELKKWRDGLLGTMAPATINRLGGCLCAALEVARQHDERIQNRQAWETGLAGLPNAHKSRNVILSDERCANSSPPPTGSIISSGCWPTCWRSPARVRAKPSGYGPRTCTIIRCAPNW